MSFEILGVQLAESELEQKFREPRVGATQVGCFEWWIQDEDEDEGACVGLVIQCRYANLNFFPDLCFRKGWGDPNYIPLENDIKALFYYEKALELAFYLELREDMHLLPCVEAWRENSFTDTLNRLKINWKG